MSNQEMQFADPDWEPTQSRQKLAGAQQSPANTPQPINDDKRERFQQPMVETPPAQQETYAGYGGYAGAIPEQPRQQTPYQYQRMPYRRRGRRPRVWLWIIIAILFFSLMGSGVSALGSIGQRSVTQANPFPQITSTPTIIINESDGNIQVHQGGSLNIEVVKHSSFFDDPNNINVKFDTTGSTITATVDQGTSFLSSRSVDFNITVPGDANLQLHTTSGDINVSGTSGAMTLSTDSGNISTANDTFASNSTLSATSGDIHSTGDTFSGEAGVTTTSGDIRMEQDSLNGPTKVTDSSGGITFDGTMATSSTSPATYQFNTSSGDIRIGLSANANMNVQAQTTSGSINADGFPPINVQDNKASGTIGTAPYSQLNLGTDSGDITIQQNHQ
jgi:Putative adhesin